MSEYELVYIVRPDIEADALSVIIDKVGKAISGQGGQVIQVEPWGKRRLTYPIQRQREGHYVYTQLQIDPGKVKGLERGFNLFEEILRHLIIKREARTERRSTKRRGARHESRTQ